MNFTIEQKEQFTLLLSRIYHNVNHANSIALVMEIAEMKPEVVKASAREARESSEAAIENVDKLKQYLMEIDNGTTK